MTKAATTPLRRDARVLGLVCTGHFISHFYQIILPPLFFFLNAEFEVGYAALGLLVTLFMGANGVSQVPTGFLVDRIGARVVLVGGLFLEAGAIGLMAVVPSFHWILVLAILAGLGHSVFHPANYAILSSSVDEGRMGRAFSMHSFAGFLGTAVSPLTIIFLANIWGWRWALGLAAVVGIATAFAILAGGGDLKDDNAPRDSAAAGGEAVSLKGGLKLLASPPMIMMFLFWVTTSLAQSGISSFSVVAIVAMYDATVTLAGWVLTAYLFAVAGGILVGGALADRTTRHDLIACVAFLVTAAMIALVGLVALPIILIIGLFALVGLCLGLVMPARDMMVRAAAPPGATGKAFGFMAAGGSVGGIVTPPLFGWMVDQGEPQGIFWIMAIFMVIAVATVLPRRKGATE
ncbi:MAG: MFS transporter [Rhodospirillales bacterium]|jgi:MFS family permease|nr:MFS transporter [Rhodospirillales bacterium]